MKEKILSVLKGAIIAAAGAALTYASEVASGCDFGPYGPLVGAALSVAVNALRKAVVKPKDEEPSEGTADETDEDAE